MSRLGAGQPSRLPLAIPPAGEARPGAIRPAAFFDRDGILNEAVPDPISGASESPLRVEDVRLIPGAADGARRMMQAGYALVCVSNQPAAAKGKVWLHDLLRIHERVLALLAEEGVLVEASRLCPHHPHGVVAELSGACDCRKPSPGMLLSAALALKLDLAASWMFGDTDADIEAGTAAGTRTALIEYPRSVHKRSGRVDARLHATDLADAVAQILDE